MKDFYALSFQCGHLVIFAHQCDVFTQACSCTCSVISETHIVFQLSSNYYKLHTWWRFSFSALRSCISSSMFCIIVSISLHFCFSALHRCSDCSSCPTSSKNTHSLNTLTNCTKHFRSDQCSLTRKLLGASIWLKFKISQMYTFLILIHSNNLFLFWRIILLKNLDKWGCLI